ncbi:hypothetical protein ABZ807_16540 [Micromonospora sp. NPDC047548]|uniref:hypothetical protein n=1 Tax=Micromonospora sp. NPDC047548 TaxID=3155624 RepID=UPI0033E4A076
MSSMERPGARAAPGMHHGTIMPTDARCLVAADESSATVRLSSLHVADFSRFIPIAEPVPGYPGHGSG